MKVRLMVVAMTLALARMAGTQQAQVDPALPSYTPTEKGLTGEISVFGASEMEKLMGLWVDSFRRVHPNVGFHVTLKGSATGVGPLVAGTAQLAPMGREMWPAEIVGFKFTYGYEPLPVAVAYGSYGRPRTTSVQVVCVNKDNPLEKLTLAQLDAIFSKTRKRGYKEEITTWGQLGLKGDWATRPINLYGMNADSGNGQAFRHVVLLNGRWRDTVRESSPSGKEVAASLAEDRFGIGFIPVGARIPSIRIVALAEKEGGPYSDASFADVIGGKYPLARNLYIYVNRASGKPLDAKVREFLRFVLSREGQEAVVREGVFLPLPAEVVRGERARIE